MKQFNYTLFLVIALSAWQESLWAQQQLYSNQNIWFFSTDNIAAVSPELPTNMQALYRRNWSNADQSPQLYMCRIETGSQKTGADLKIQNYRNQFYQRTELKTGYRYRLQLDDNQHLAVGLRFGFLQSNYNWSIIRPQHPEELLNENLPQQSFKSICDFGFFYTLKNFKAGLSGTNFSLKNTASPSFQTIRELPSFCLLATQSFKLANFIVAPVLQVRSSLGLPAIVDIALLMEKKNKFGLQCGFRTNTSVYANVRGYVSKQLAIAFSYDYPFITSKYVGSGNELSIQFFTK